MKQIKIIPENKIISFMSLYPGKTRDEVETIVLSGLKKKIKPLLGIAIAVIVILTAIEIKSPRESSNVIERNAMGESKKTVELLISNEEISSQISYDVSAIMLLPEEIDKLHEEVSEQLNNIVLSGNSSFNDIRSDLTFPTELAAYNVSMTWATDNPAVINTRGVVKNSSIETDTPVEIVAKIYYGEEYRFYRQNTVVKPVVYTPEEEMINKALSELREMDLENKNQLYFEIPERLSNMSISVVTKQHVSKILVGVLLAFIIILYGYSQYFSDLNEKRKKRKIRAEDQYKDFVSRLYLLLSTGLGIRLCLKRINEEYEKARKQSLLSDNLQVLIRELETGEYEVKAYNNFGNRMESVNYQRLSSILVQQTTKGVRNISETLESEVKQAYLSDKEKIRIKGEEASTKLLLPMLGMMLIVFAVLLMPALSNF